MKYLILLTDLCTQAAKTTYPLRRGHKIPLDVPPADDAIQLLPPVQWHEHESHADGELLYATQNGITYKFPRKCCSVRMYGGGIHFLIASIRESQLEIIRVRRVDETPERSPTPVKNLRDISIEQLGKHPISMVMMQDACSRYIEAVTIG